MTHEAVKKRIASYDWKRAQMIGLEMAFRDARQGQEGFDL